MSLDYIVADPTKNITILVRTPVPREEYAATARTLLANVPSAEQVGFLLPPKEPGSRIGMCMMGGEFCGNATMSTAAFAAASDGLGPGEQADILLEASGAEGPLRCRIEGLAPGPGFKPEGPFRTDSFTGTLRMPLPVRISGAPEAPFPGPCVFYDGIVHVIVGKGAFAREEIPGILRDLAGRQGLAAVGMLEWDEETSHMTPCVYVRDTDSAVWEQGCASGSAAIGAFRAVRLAGESGPGDKAGAGDKAGSGAEDIVTTDVHQPGGVITATAVVRSGKLTALCISGNIVLTHLPGKESL